MSQINGKKLTYGALHAPIFVPGLGQLGATLTNTDSGTNKAVKMTVDEPFVLIEVARKVGNQNKSVTVPVPITSFTHMVVED